MEIGRQSVVVITGASRGIGRAAAIEFGRRGATVILASRDQPRLQEVAAKVKEAGGAAEIVPCDVSNENDCQGLIQKTVSAFGRLDVLVNNAGYGHYAAIEKLPTQDLENIFRTNLFGSFWCAQAAIPIMRKQKRGHIVNVSTVISKRSLPFSTAYCMTKFAMNAMDEGLRLEVKPDGIGVSHVCPGLTATEFQDNAGRTGAQPPMHNKGGMSAERVGRAIVRAVECERREVILTIQGKLLVLLQRLSPSLVDWILTRFFARKFAAPK